MINIEHVAKLARLGLGKEEIAKLDKDMAAILEFVEKLKEVDVEKVPPMAQATGLINILREDEEIKREEKARQKILANVPEKKENYIKVKGVFE
jgi:aspartyl-tRNA(Asn)/glutamyl-tRNA(Gln) amidotransferase subunit C